MKKKIESIFTLSMIFQGLLWIILSIISLTNETVMFPIISYMMIMNGICFILLAIIFEKNLMIKVATMVFIILNIILTVTDQMGLIDYLVLVLNILVFLGCVYKLKTKI
ncbi:MAG: hypothetical protein ACOWWH_10105 [Eubacteriaceae bacterium]